MFLPPNILTTTGRRIRVIPRMLLARAYVCMASHPIIASRITCWVASLCCRLKSNFQFIIHNS